MAFPLTVLVIPCDDRSIGFRIDIGTRHNNNDRTIGEWPRRLSATAPPGSITSFN
jgi:hypothetical protein